MRVSLVRMAASAMRDYTSFTTLSVTRPRPFVVAVNLNRPDKSNAINMPMWSELRQCFDELATDPDCRAVVLGAEGKNFCAGIDLQDLSADVLGGDGDPARTAMKIRSMAKKLQDSFNAMERCPKPVIAAVHRACIGGGVDMITACDIRLCTSDSTFQVKEVDVGLAADVGTLQRLPKVIGNQSLVRELCFTARAMPAHEALDAGLVSRVCHDKEELLSACLTMAETIASKSPVAVQGTKVNLIYSRDHSVEEGLNFVSLWNGAMLQTDDLMEAMQASMAKRSGTYSKL
eukprot:m.13322 g.13322  ORF g.13322 m.13322 type:complete len:289 (-) comp4522_c0_seq1:82-948(-)